MVVGLGLAVDMRLDTLARTDIPDAGNFLVARCTDEVWHNWLLGDADIDNRGVEIAIRRRLGVPRMPEYPIGASEGDHPSAEMAADGFITCLEAPTPLGCDAMLTLRRCIDDSPVGFRLTDAVDADVTDGVDVSVPPAIEVPRMLDGLAAWWGEVEGRLPRSVISAMVQQHLLRISPFASLDGQIARMVAVRILSTDATGMLPLNPCRALAALSDRYTSIIVRESHGYATEDFISLWLNCIDTTIDDIIVKINHCVDYFEFIKRPEWLKFTEQQKRFMAFAIRFRKKLDVKAIRNNGFPEDYAGYRELERRGYLLNGSITEKCISR
jgi:hypothetical protein